MLCFRRTQATFDHCAVAAAKYIPLSACIIVPGLPGSHRLEELAPPLPRTLFDPDMGQARVIPATWTRV
jgi:hypothetical protein